MCMGVGLGEIRGIRPPPPTPAKGPQFGTKSRRMVFLVPNHFEWFGDYSVWSCPSVRVSVSVSVRVSVRGQTLYAHLLLAATFQQVDTHTI